jgi:hypothetical protein
LEILSNEHGLIRQFPAHLALTLGRLEAGEKVPAQFVEKGVDFARNFADTASSKSIPHFLSALLEIKMVPASHSACFPPEE